MVAVAFFGYPIHCSSNPYGWVVRHEFSAWARESTSFVVQPREAQTDAAFPECVAARRPPRKCLEVVTLAARVFRKTDERPSHGIAKSGHGAKAPVLGCGDNLPMDPARVSVSGEPFTNIHEYPWICIRGYPCTDIRVWICMHGYLCMKIQPASQPAHWPKS